MRLTVGARLCDLLHGVQDVAGAGSREEQVYPSEEGVVAVDLDFGRISLAICEWQ